MNTKFKTAAAAAAHLADDPSVEQRVKEEICRNSVVTTLIEMRVEKGLTQEQIAQSMECDASVISRIESGNDRQLKWADITGYCNALKLGMNIMFVDNSLPAAARIHQCVLKIHEDLEMLAKLATEVGTEDTIAQEINRFYREVLFNFLIRFKKNHDLLPATVKVPARSTAETEPDEKGDDKNSPCELTGV
jgi:transcriptional regulator with XRE-family HTH domain